MRVVVRCGQLQGHGAFSRMQESLVWLVCGAAQRHPEPRHVCGSREVSRCLRAMDAELEGGALLVGRVGGRATGWCSGGARVQTKATRSQQRLICCAVSSWRVAAAREQINAFVGDAIERKDPALDRREGRVEITALCGCGGACARDLRKEWDAEPLLQKWPAVGPSALLKGGEQSLGGGEPAPLGARLRLQRGPKPGPAQK